MHKEREKERGKAECDQERKKEINGEKDENCKNERGTEIERQDTKKQKYRV